MSNVYLNPKECGALIEQINRLRDENARLVGEMEALQVDLDCELRRYKEALEKAKVAWKTGRGRVHANFGHVPEVIRACDWIEVEMSKALRHINEVLKSP